MKRVKCFLLALFMVLVRSTFAAEEPVVIYGSCMYSESSDMSWGIYSFPASGPAEFTPVWVSGDLMANGGAVYADGKYYVVSYLDFGGGMAIAAFLKCDVENQEMDFVQIPDWNISYITTDMTFDPQTGNVYGCSFNSDGSGNFVLSILDTQTGRQQEIAGMEQMCALAADKEGRLYGIGANDGVLYLIDKTNAGLTAVGPTGVVPQSSQSATFDLDSGIMYWSAYTAEGGALYTVDTETGQATLVSEYSDKTQITGIYILPAERTEPVAPSDVTLNFEDGSLTGSVDFTMPLLNADSNPLEGNIDYVINVDNVPLVSGEALPGDKVSAPVTLEASGNYYFTIVIKNDGGAAPAVNITRFIGVDTPKAVENIVIDNNDGLVSLSWELPDSGANDGFIDKDMVTYRIVRWPDNVVAAENYAGNVFSETVAPEKMSICFYSISAILEGNEGEESTSDYVVIGSNLEVPVDENLGDVFRFPLFTVIDGNADNATWRFDYDFGYATYEWAYDDENDDWLISPPVRLEAGTDYRMKCWLHSEADKYSSEVRFVMGTTPDVSGMNKVLMDAKTVDKAENTEFESDLFSVEADGLYYLGIHVTGNSSIYYLLAERFMVEEAEESSVGMTEGGECQIKMSKTGDCVSVYNPEGNQIHIYDAAGLLVGEYENEYFEIKLEKGVYILKSGHYSRKFAI